MKNEFFTRKFAPAAQILQVVERQGVIYGHDRSICKDSQ